jgi:hypothetical protein
VRPGNDRQFKSKGLKVKSNDEMKSKKKRRRNANKIAAETTRERGRFEHFAMLEEVWGMVREE